MKIKGREKDQVKANWRMLGLAFICRIIIFVTIACIVNIWLKNNVYTYIDSETWGIIATDHIIIASVLTFAVDFAVIWFTKKKTEKLWVIALVIYTVFFGLLNSFIFFYRLPLDGLQISHFIIPVMFIIGMGFLPLWIYSMGESHMDDFCLEPINIWRNWR